MMKLMSKTALLLAGFLLLVGIFLPTSIKAQGCPPDGPWYEQTPCQFSKKVKEPNNESEIFGERYTYAQINWIINSLAIIIAPDDPAKFIDESKKLIQKAVTGQKPSFQEYVSLGPAGYLLGGISEIYAAPPASGVQEIKGLAARVFDYSTAVTPAHAQGFGFSNLSGIQILWTASRNMAYFLVVILLIAGGFLVMFRVKINPQTAVSVQVLIPKLIISLILITFSYAIAGLVIDLVYVMITFFIAVLQLSGTISPSNISEAIRLFTTTNGGWIIGYFLVPWLLVVIVGMGITFLPTIVTTIAGSLVALLSVIVMVFLIFQLVKIWWMLMKSYITLVLLIAVGPLQIMLDVIPGQSGFGPWIRNVIANASVFVVVPMMFMINLLFWKPFFGLSTFPEFQQIIDFLNSLGADLSGLSPLGTIRTGVNPTTPLPNLPFINGSGFIFNLAIGYVILTITPKIAEMIRDALKVPAFKYGTSAGEIAGNLITTGKVVQLGGLAAREGSKIIRTTGAGTAPKPTKNSTSVNNSTEDRTWNGTYDE